MKRINISENVVVIVMQVTGCMALLLLLTYTAWHTGTLFSRYIALPLFGYAAAIGVEISVVTLSAWIGLHRKANRSVKKPMIVLGLVVLVSMLANIAEGFVSRYGDTMAIGTIRSIDPLQAGIGVVSTGLISVIVFALSDILGSNVRTVSDNVRKSKDDRVELSSDFVVTEKSAKSDRMAWIVAMEGQVTPEMIVRQFGVTERTAYRDLGGYKDNGQSNNDRHDME